MRIAAGHILVRQYRVDAFELTCRRRVNGPHTGVGNLGAFRACIEHAGEPVVVCKTSRSLDLCQGIRVRTRLADLVLRRAGFREVRRYILARCLQDGVDDALVTGAAAVGVFERRTNIGFSD